MFHKYYIRSHCLIFIWENYPCQKNIHSSIICRTFNLFFLLKLEYTLSLFQNDNLQRIQKKMKLVIKIIILNMHRSFISGERIKCSWSSKTSFNFLYHQSHIEHHEHYNIPSRQLILNATICYQLEISWMISKEFFDLLVNKRHMK